MPRSREGLPDPWDLDGCCDDRIVSSMGSNFSWRVSARRQRFLRLHNNRNSRRRDAANAVCGNWGMTRDSPESAPNGCAGDHGVLSRVSAWAEVASFFQIPFAFIRRGKVHMLCPYSSSNCFSTCSRGSISSCVQSHGPSFQFLPQVGHSPAHRDRQTGCSGSASSISCRMTSVKSMM